MIIVITLMMLMKLMMIMGGRSRRIKCHYFTEAAKADNVIKKKPA